MSMLSSPRVLAVDDDPTDLIILEKMLEECQYRVTKCSSGMAALQLLREKEDAFDMIICEVDMAEMGGLELLEYVGLMMDIPFILMSAVDKEKNVVSEGLARGACNYLMKPIPISHLKTAWLHAVQLNELREYKLEEHMENESEDSSDDDDWQWDPESGFIWTDDVHWQFVGVVNHLGGFDKADPSRILKLMSQPNLTMKYVAYQLHEARLLIMSWISEYGVSPY